MLFHTWRFFLFLAYRSEERFLGFVLGSSRLRLFVFILAALHLAHKVVFLGLGILLIVLDGLAIRDRSLQDLPPLPRMWRIVFCAVHAGA